MGTWAALCSVSKEWGHGWGCPPSIHPLWCFFCTVPSSAFGLLTLAQLHFVLRLSLEESWFCLPRSAECARSWPHDYLPSQVRACRSWPGGTDILRKVQQGCRLALFRKVCFHFGWRRRAEPRQPPFDPSTPLHHAKTLVRCQSHSRIHGKRAENGYWAKFLSRTGTNMELIVSYRTCTLHPREEAAHWRLQTNRTFVASRARRD